MKRTTVWFLEPLDSRTSNIIAWEIRPEDECREVLCTDGKRRNFYRCEWALVKAVLSSVGEMSLRVAVWRQQGVRPPERFDPKLFSGRPLASVRDAKKRLAEIKNNDTAP